MMATNEAREAIRQINHVSLASGRWTPESAREYTSQLDRAANVFTEAVKPSPAEAQARLAAMGIKFEPAPTPHE